MTVDEHGGDQALQHEPDDAAVERGAQAFVEWFFLDPDNPGVTDHDRNLVRKILQAAMSAGGADD